MSEEYNWEESGFDSDEIETLKDYFYDETGVDKAIAHCKEIQSDIERLNELFKNRVKDFTDSLQYDLEVKVNKLKKLKDFHLGNIKNFAVNHPKKTEAKTQWKVTLLSGDIVIKKASDKFIKPEKLTEEVISKDLSKYKKENTTTTVSLDWAGMKKNLEIRLVDGEKKVFDTSVTEIVIGKKKTKVNGVDVSKFVSIEQVPEEVEIK